MVKWHGPDFLGCKRFGVEQKDKVRPIDDFSQYFHNACVTSTDKVNVSGVDSIASMIRLWSKVITSAAGHKDHLFEITLSDGRTLQGRLHPDFWKCDLAGTCVDLESAYKQLAVDPAHASLSIFALKNPDTSEVEFFEACALPFGATAAVHGFNRMSQALETILTDIFGIPCTHYFDDFTFILPNQWLGLPLTQPKRF